MQVDPEILEAFVSELTELKPKLYAPYLSLHENVNQPAQFLAFAQIIDGVYGTAMTLGFTEIGEYTGALRQMCRKCGSTNIPRAMPEVFKMLKRCLDNFDALSASIKNPAEIEKINKEMKLETARAKRLEEQVFAFIKPA